MVEQVQQTLDTLYWPLRKVLEEEGLSVLEWAILQRARRAHGGVRFADVIKATGQLKVNVRRAALSLANSGLGEVIVVPTDHRARIFRLSQRGRNRMKYVEENFQALMLSLIGANLKSSQRVKEFTRYLLTASGFLPPGDLADRSSYQRWDMPDDTLGLEPEPVHPRPIPIPRMDVMPW
jgi:DNA-binding MarR family transcriptional regulator